MSVDVRVVAVLSMIASACASACQIGVEARYRKCGTDSSGWRISDAPANADNYRQLATENPHYKSQHISEREWGYYDQETWLIKSSGEVILCLADGPPWEAWSTRFWRFTPPDEDSGQLKIAEQAETITVG